MNFWTRLRFIAIVASLTVLGACSVGPTPKGTVVTSALQQCQSQLELIVTAVTKNNTQDAQYHPVEGFPTYRSNRFWSSFHETNLNQNQTLYWRKQLHTLGMDSLALEWQNLPPNASPVDSFADFRKQCGLELFNASLQQPLPPQQANVPDSYSDLQRFFGFYALVKHGAASSIADYQQEMRQRIEQFEAPNIASKAFTPAQSEQDNNITTTAWLNEAYTNNPLQVPQLPAQQLQTLLLAHAPNIEIAQQSEADLPGSAVWQEQEDALIRQIDPNQPTLYTYPSYIRFDGHILLQLNYTLWFSERPKPTSNDWYGGELDGLVWRVTLQRNGDVLFYDSIHPCGCYHSVHIPSGSPLQARIHQSSQQESLEPILFFDNTITSQETRPWLFLEAGTHYLAQVGKSKQAGATTTQTYRLQPYNTLRSLPARQGFRSWFDSDGLIASSSRRERYFLWPLGVPNAGAMRQQGHHAIAFVGKRHFDEASVEALLELTD